MDKVLILTYYWPPGSGSGVQRWLKFAKYLPVHGWEPVILTVDPDYATYPALDSSLQDDVPPGLTVYRTRARDYFRFYNKDKSRIPSAGFAQGAGKGFGNRLSRFVRGNFFLPDPRRGWNRYAFQAAREIIKTEGITRIITTSPPHSTQLVGLKLRKQFPSLKWIADLRDPWTDIFYYDMFYPTILSRAIDRMYEKQVLKNADRIITVGNSLERLFSAKLPGMEQKISIITNGYDDTDFDGDQPPLPEIFTISYTGALSDNHPLDTFLKAIKSLDEDGICYRLRFTGTVSEGQSKLIDSIIPPGKTEFIPHTEHSRAIKYMRDSSALLLLIPEHESSTGIITGKLFEYLAARRPIICLGPTKGDASLILEETGHGKCFDYRDVGGVSNFLRSLADGREEFSFSTPAGFSRQNLTAKVAELLRQC